MLYISSNVFEDGSNNLNRINKGIGLCTSETNSNKGK